MQKSIIGKKDGEFVTAALQQEVDGYNIADLSLNAGLIR
jgi:hypothetical protein